MSKLNQEQSSTSNLSNDRLEITLQPKPDLFKSRAEEQEFNEFKHNQAMQCSEDNLSYQLYRAYILQAVKPDWVNLATLTESEYSKYYTKRELTLKELCYD